MKFILKTSLFFILLIAGALLLPPKAERNKAQEQTVTDLQPQPADQHQVYMVPATETR